MGEIQILETHAPSKNIKLASLRMYRVHGIKKKFLSIFLLVYCIIYLQTTCARSIHVWKQNKKTHNMWYELHILLHAYLLVMGIGNIFKIDDRYINIDRWSIIGDNCLLNVFTDYN